MLHHQDITVSVLASGSRGNCTYIGNGNSGVLVDCGLSTRHILRRMVAQGLGSAPIDAVLITHEHSDHIGAARVLCNKLHQRTGRRVPFFMTRGTHNCANKRVLPKRVEHIRAGREFQVGSLSVQPVAVPHDTLEPVSFSVSMGPVRVAVMTDFGRPTRLVARQLATADIAVLEFNHDVQMLMDGGYPWRLKERVRGNHGHLSNAQAAELLATAGTSRLKGLVLAHLSQENNHPDLALEAAYGALHHAGLSDVEVVVGLQDQAADPLSASVPVREEPIRIDTARSASSGRRASPPARSPEQLSLF